MGGSWDHDAMANDGYAASVSKIIIILLLQRAREIAAIHNSFQDTIRYD